MNFSAFILPLFLLVFLRSNGHSYTWNYTMLCNAPLSTVGLKGTSFLFDGPPTSSIMSFVVTGESGIAGERGKREYSDLEVARLKQTVREWERKLKHYLGLFAYGRVYNNNSNCDDLYRQGTTVDGFYRIVVQEEVIEVFCEFQKDQYSNWLIIQKRYSGEVDFYLDWHSYQVGFGNKNGEFWLGLEKIHALTNSTSHMLRVELEDWEGNSVHADYSFFVVGDASSNYRLGVSGYSGNAGDSLRSHNNDFFSTKDRDNDKSENNCAADVHGAWWYNGCYSSNLNGKYLHGGKEDDRGMTWYYWKETYHSIKKSIMKIKPN